MKVRIFLFSLLIFAAQFTNAQIHNPVDWDFEAKHVKGNEYDLIFKAEIKPGWYIYSQYLESDDGPVKTSFEYEAPADLEKVGKNKEASPSRKEGYDDLFEMNVIKFGKKATFTQRIKVKDPNVAVTGYLEFMCCDAEKCLPPEEVDFEFKLPAAAAPTPPPAPKPEAKPEPTPAPAPEVKPVPPPAPKPEPKPAPKTETQPVEKPATKPATKPTPKPEPKPEPKTNTAAKENENTEAATKTEDEAVAEPAAPEETNPGNSQESGILDPVKWLVSHKKLDDGTYQIDFKADLDDGWYIYSQELEAGGPEPTEIGVMEEGAAELLGKAKEISDYQIKGFDKTFEMEVTKYKKDVVFSQKIKPTDATKPLEAFVYYMTCDDEKCLPPEELPVMLDLSKDRDFYSISDASITPDPSNVAVNAAGNVTGGVNTPVQETFNKANANDACGEVQIVEENRSYWRTFALGFLGGLIAILTPCVFPMIPLTVSFFMKGNKSKAKGLRDALIYGLSIIFIYTGLGTALTLIFGADILNAISSDPWFNLFLFVLLIVFAISFFGYFEIGLPTKWADKADAVADKGGLIGIFFMALVLAIVSFSCTGPLIGALLVEAVSDSSAGGIALNPIFGMLGFSIALALPFALFAAFPSWLASLPKSGGWMGDVKVSVGFMEVAFSLKFLAVFDILMHKSIGFKLLPYEIFLGVWILVAIMWGLYFLGVNPFPAKGTQKVGIVKILLALGLFAIAGYLFFGFKADPNTKTYTSLSMTSGIAPPVCHNLWKPCDCPHNIDCNKNNYFAAKEIAKKTGKPLFIDFTGHSCENCRRMEEQVWGEPDILPMLTKDFVVTSLYVDERTVLDEPYESIAMKKKRRKVGHLWTDFQVTHFNSNSQPKYIIATPKGEVMVILNKPIGSTSKENFKDFLECGLDRHMALKKGMLGLNN